MNGRANDTRQSRSWLLLGLLLAASFIVRVAGWAYWRTGAIESEGAEYARIAENLRNGAGYVGIVSPGPQLVFPPLLPFLIAAASFVTQDFESAGRLVSVVFGTLLPLPLFGIGSSLFNRKAGLIAAMLAVLHPVLVNLSFSVFSEGPYTTLFLIAVYLVVRGLHTPSVKLWFLVGTAFGLAYLTRQEATVALLIAVLFALFATEGRAAVKCGRAAAAIGMFLMVALPEVIFIYRATGKVRLEGKSTQFFALGQRILAADENRGSNHKSSPGQPDEPSPAPNVPSWQSWQEKWAFYSVDNQLNRNGTAMRSHTQVVRETRITLRDMFRLVLKGVRLNAPTLIARLSERWIGAPFLPALAFLGAFRRPWRRPQAWGRLFLVLVAAAPVIATFSALWTQTRYYFVLVPLLLIWAGNGLLELGLWTKASPAAMGWAPHKPSVFFPYLLPGFLTLALIIYPIKAIRQPDFIFAEGSVSSRVAKELGLWIRSQQSRTVRIMDLTIPVAFHADAQWAQFPYCSGDVALRFLNAEHVDYIVLRRGASFTRYYDDWLKHGITDSRAELVHVSPEVDAAYAVYRWHRTGYAASKAITSRPCSPAA